MVRSAIQRITSFLPLTIHQWKSHSGSSLVIRSFIPAVRFISRRNAAGVGRECYETATVEKEADIWARFPNLPPGWNVKSGSEWFTPIKRERERERERVRESENAGEMARKQENENAGETETEEGF